MNDSLQARRLGLPKTKRGRQEYKEYPEKLLSHSEPLTPLNSKAQRLTIRPPREWRTGYVLPDLIPYHDRTSGD